ncbi:MAG: glutamine synthetase type III, partial [Clostridia bacterium]|nr:glutamine synthetase type III [Clostridia bacterium]
KTIKDHRRIIFNGNGYDDAGIKEATEVRGLLNYRTTADCMPHLLDKKNVDMLTSHKVFSIEELRSRCDIMLENYVKTVAIEAGTMIEMAKTQIAPAIRRFAADTARDVTAKLAFDEAVPCANEKKLVLKLSALSESIAEKVSALEEAMIAFHGTDDVFAGSEMIRDDVLPKMCELRVACDEAETITEKSYWPFPTYGDILFSVK